MSTGFFGLSESLAPLTEANLDGDDLLLNYDKAKVKDAPNVDADQNLDADEERALYAHYGLDYGADSSAPGDGTGTLGGPAYLVPVPKPVRAPAPGRGSRSHPACLRLAHRGGRLSRDTL